jgi:hemoglobin
LFERVGGRAGLDELLHYFYADVRQHNLIGPVFASKISDWPAHLKIIGDFWARVTGGPSPYNRSMPAKHIGLGLQEAHFQAWLDLWYRQCRARLKSAEAEEMIGLAEAFASRLRYLIVEP